jgi:glycogen synthase
MFGWEFPPFKSGGLGQACRDLCKGLDHLGKEVTFVMPITPEQVGETDHADVIGARRTITNRSSGSSIHYKTVPTPLKPYSDPLTYSERVQSLMDTGLIEAESPEGQTESVYGVNLIDEVERYGRVAAQIAREQNFDVIHAHDWMTYRAGLVAREISGKPLVVHIHATEFDRTADNPTQEIEAREYEGLDRADLVIANSKWTRRLLKNPCIVSGSISKQIRPGAPIIIQHVR